MQRNRNLFFQMGNYLFFIIIGILTIYPFWYTLVGSMIDFSEYSRKIVLLFPEHLNFLGYQKILSDDRMMNAFKITVFITIVGTLFNLFFTSLGAYVLSVTELPGRKYLLYIVIFTMLFSGGLIPTYLTLKNYHLLDNVWVYIFPSLINTFYLIIMKTNFQSTPKELKDAAHIDGCSDVGILFKIIIPISLPVLAAIGLFYTVDHWNELFTALFYINDVKKLTLQAVLYGMVTTVDVTTQNVGGLSQRGQIPEQVKLAAVIIATVPILFVYPFLQKYFVKGVLVGAIKG